MGIISGKLGLEAEDRIVEYMVRDLTYRVERLMSGELNECFEAEKALILEGRGILEERLNKSWEDIDTMIYGNPTLKPSLGFQFTWYGGIK